MDNIIKQRNEKSLSILLRKQKEEKKIALINCINKWVKETQNKNHN